jgi:hypothetical protein
MPGALRSYGLVVSGVSVVAEGSRAARWIASTEAASDRIINPFNESCHSPFEANPWLERGFA